MDPIDADPEVIDIADDSDVVAEAPQDVEPDSDVVVVDDSEAVAADTSENHEETAEATENGENGEDEAGDNLNPFADEDDSDEDGGGVQVTIRKIEPTEKPAARQGKLDIDATPMINDKPIYDIDLAQMEDRPWRKPGADITDYFNYGFTEDTWNMYCERQKKVRIEFSGNQQAANNALFSSIKVTNPLANPVMNTNSSPASVVKVLTDNGGRFKQPTYSQPSHQNNDQVIRTVITGNNAPAPMAPNPLMDFTKPPPGMSLPPMGMPPVSLPTSAADIFSDAPPGVDGGSDRPPGVESSVNPIPGVLGVPGVPGIPGVPGVPGGLDLHLGLPPMGFNPNMPPPGMNLGMMSTNLPPPSFNMPPPSFQAARAGFGQVGMGGGPRGMMPPGPSFNREISDEDDERRQRRKRSRSRSPRRGDRDRDSRRRGERESERVSSRRHRSRSTSRDRRRRDDREREKRRDRRDDDDRSKKRSRHDDDDRRESSSRKEKKIKVEEESVESTGAPNESPVVE